MLRSIRRVQPEFDAYQSEWDIKQNYHSLPEMSTSTSSTSRSDRSNNLSPQVTESSTSTSTSTTTSLLTDDEIPPKSSEEYDDEEVEVNDETDSFHQSKPSPSTLSSSSSRLQTPLSQELYLFGLSYLQIFLLHLTHSTGKDFFHWFPLFERFQVKDKDSLRRLKYSTTLGDGEWMENIVRLSGLWGRQMTEEERKTIEDGLTAWNGC